ITTASTVSASDALALRFFISGSASFYVGAFGCQCGQSTIAQGRWLLRKGMHHCLLSADSVEKVGFLELPKDWPAKPLFSTLLREISA
ncbi:hypothetical protein, partial [Pseudomonas sp.]|uniref:hypothetical protein n=1 Tax=Pseudomonas sp. TaxID=306 RepID=UPI00262E1450